MSSAIFFDTGAWIAMINTGDQHHEQAKTFFHELPLALNRTTSSQVISETYTWLRYKSGFHKSSSFLKIIRESCDNQTLHMITDQEADLLKAEQILEKFPDQKLSYTDALSMAMMERRSISKVFTFDHHFYLMNFEVYPF